MGAPGHAQSVRALQRVCQGEGQGRGPEGRGSEAREPVGWWGGGGAGSSVRPRGMATTVWALSHGSQRPGAQHAYRSSHSSHPDRTHTREPLGLSGQE